MISVYIGLSISACRCNLCTLHPRMKVLLRSNKNCAVHLKLILVLYCHVGSTVFFLKNEICRCEITKSYIKSKKDKQSYKIKSKIIIYFKSPWSLLELNNANTILSMALTSHLYKKGSLGCQIVLKFTKVSKIAKV